MEKFKVRLFIWCVLVLGILINFTSYIVQAEPVQWDSNGHWYEFIEAPSINWFEANSVANTKSFNGLQGHLVTIKSEEELQFIVDNVEIYVGCWIGAFQAEGSLEPDGGWMWITGEFWEYTNWAPGEPNNGGDEGENAAIFTNEPYWNDMNASFSENLIAGYVIEYEATQLERIETLEAQVEELIQQIMYLREYVKEHSHTYLTGEGRGHNNTKAVTGSALFPDTP